MTVFKTYWKLLKRNLPLVILYTVILIGFSAANMKTNEKDLDFVASKPNIIVVNQDEQGTLSRHLIDYLKTASHLKVATSTEEEQINDALFYREANYVIYIPDDYSETFMAGSAPELTVKSTGDYQASLAEMILSRYLNTASIYQKMGIDAHELTTFIDETLAQTVKINMVSLLDVDQLTKATSYYNFASYSILACLIFIVSLLLNHFNQPTVKKRRLISPMGEKKHNRILLFSNSLYALLIWLIYVAISFLLVGDIMWSPHGLIYIINAFMLTLCATSLAFLIGTLVRSPNAISGIVNVIALGSSFLCGAFVPMEWLPDSVLTIAHAIPTFYYIKTNELLKTVEAFHLDTLKPILINMVIIFGFSVLFMILTQLVSQRRRKIG